MAFVVPLLASLAPRILPMILPLAARGVASILPKILRPSMLGKAGNVLNFISSHSKEIGSAVGEGITTGAEMYKEGKEIYKSLTDKKQPQLQQPQLQQPQQQQYEVKSAGAKKIANILDNLLNGNQQFTSRDMQFLQTLEHMRLARGIQSNDINNLLLNAENKNKMAYQNLHRVMTYDTLIN